MLIIALIILIILIIHQFLIMCGYMVIVLLVPNCHNQFDDQDQSDFIFPTGWWLMANIWVS